MSSRQIRRLQEKLNAAKLAKNEEPVSEDEFEPLYMTSRKKSNDLPSPKEPEDGEESSGLKGVPGSFSLLSATADTDTASQSEAQGEEEGSDDQPVPDTSQRKNKNNRKKRNKLKVKTPAQHDPYEVERALAEVNWELGTPSPTPAVPSPTPGGCHETSRPFGTALLKVDHKYLSSEDEFTRRFGPDEDDARRNRRPNVLRQLKRQITLPHESYNFTVHGVSMEQIQVEPSGDGVKYFKFVHSLKYQPIMRNLIAIVQYQLTMVNRNIIDVEVFSDISIEAAVQNADMFFMMEEATAAVNILEGSIHLIQSLFCPSFNYFDGKSRLEYEHVENRPFHIILLKYLHVLTNKACHRTALEIAKLLLNLDPSDPLGVIFIIDTLALRAREHQWLVDLYKIWVDQRDAGRLFHMLYSHALAKYHIYLKTKNPDDLESADHHLTSALMQYPSVALMLFAHCSHRCPRVTSHHLFTSLTKTSQDLRGLQQLYVAFAGGKWREGNAMKWVSEVAWQLCLQYDSCDEMKANCYGATKACYLLFKKNPPEIQRHLQVISSMSTLLVDGAVPDVVDTFSFNPYPRLGRCIDVNSYFLKQSRVDHATWRAFIESLVTMVPRPENNAANNG